jgi:hypothetical protein
LGKEALHILDETGFELSMVRSVDTCLNPLEQLFTRGRFYAGFARVGSHATDWVNLVRNKYGVSVGGLFSERNQRGHVLILPDLPDKDAAIVQLLQEVLPNLAPDLFPYFEGFQWPSEPEYELPSVLAKKTQQDRIKAKANKAVGALEEEISQERTKLGFFHGILTKQGAGLVGDVKQSLERLGFERVIDVDSELEGGEPEEDVRIEDVGPLIVCEVKGLAGMPTEDDTNQVVKYVNRRMREHNRTDVRGLFIVNHQKNLPPLDRDNANVFTEKQIADARAQHCTLAATWDLFRLLRGIDELGWPPETVRGLLEIDGRMPVVPSHYEPVGTIVKLWADAGVISVRLKHAGLAVGDRVGFKCAHKFIEQRLDSMEIDKNAVTRADKASTVGVKSAYAKGELPRGAQVFRIGEPT